MVAIAPPLAPPMPLTVEPIQWSTFQALIAELQEDQHYRIAYSQEQLTLDYSCPEAEGLIGTVRLKGIGWSTYRLLMTDVGNHRAWRIAYINGVLELRMPLEEHEEPK